MDLAVEDLRNIRIGRQPLRDRAARKFKPLPVVCVPPFRNGIGVM